MNDASNISALVDALETGHTILYPTATVWGLGCDATNAAAVEKVGALKQRSPEKSYILLADSLAMLQEYVAYIPPKANNLITYYERPLTIIYERPQNLPDSVLAADGSVAIRVTKHPFCKALIEAFGKPIVSTSANISGEPFPQHFDNISPQIKANVGAIAQVDSSLFAATANPSTIVKVIDGQDLIFIR